MRSQLKKCLVLLPPEVRWRWLAVIPLVILTAAFEGIGAAAVFALVRIVTDPAQALAMPGVSAIIARLGWRDERSILLSFTALVALFSVLKNGLLTVTESARSRCVGEATAALSATVLRGYLGVPYAFHLRRNSAQLIYTVDQAVQQVFRTVMSPVLSIITEALVVVGIVTVLLLTSPVVTLIAGTVLLALAMGLLRLTRRQAVEVGARSQALSRAALEHLQQALGAIKEVKVLGRERFFAEAFANVQHTLVRLRHLHAILSLLPRVVVETVFLCGALLVIVLITIGGGTGPAAVSLLGLYAYAGFRVIPSVNRILWHLSEIRHGRALIDQLHDDFITVRRYAGEQGGHSGARPSRFVDRVVLDRVSYAYEGKDRPVLREVSLVIRRGESVGIVGPTGAGKSTVVDLIVGLLDPSSGRITVDGVDIRDRVSAWQRQIGYVPQSIFLIDDSLRRNIALGIPDGNIDEDRVRAAVRIAQLDELLASLPSGLDTVVGERGVRLSGGERQRVGIARALYHEPEVLVFDEATSAVDNRTEAELTRAIEALRGEKTLIFIAHRLSTVRHCDRLVFLQDGRVAGVGSFQELIQDNADFRDMAAMTADGGGGA